MAKRVKTQHIWMPDGRSLCDRHALSRGLALSDVSDEDLEEYIREQATAPACGPCLLLVSRIRRQGAALLKSAGGSVHPSKPTAAWQTLAGTRWDAEVDLDAFLERTDLDDRILYDAICLAVDPESVDQLVQERSEHLQRLRALLKERQKNGADAER